MGAGGRKSFSDSKKGDKHATRWGGYTLSATSQPYRGKGSKGPRTNFPLGNGAHPYAHSPMVREGTSFWLKSDQAALRGFLLQRDRQGKFKEIEVNDEIKKKHPVAKSRVDPHDRVVESAPSKTY